MAMTVGNTFKDWKKLAVLVTAFTIGHSVTLALATLRMVIIPAEITEFLIPCTILLTSIYQVATGFKAQGRFLYLMVLGFGFIHGLGFSNFLQQTLSTEDSLVGPLFAFNIGLEIGQLLILSIFLLVSFFVVKLLKFAPANWYTYVAGMAGGIAIILMINQT